MEECRNPKENTPACIPFFVHENALMHYNNVNRRMMVILVTVCITFVLTIATFVFGCTIREKNILDSFMQLQNTGVAADEGIYQQPNP